MQNRFKFRVWHVPTKTMYEVYEFNKDFVKATPDLVVASIRTLRTKDCIIMQCTGLKDKNGNLIYEGDIISVEYEGRKYIATIDYDEDDTGFGCNYHFRENGELCSIAAMDIYGTIIDNIYQNQEPIERNNPDDK